MKLKKKINLYRRYPYWNKQDIIFIHIPKAAGTSINNAIYGCTLGHYSAVEIQSTFPILFERSFIFSFVRNPWARLLSAYSFAKQGQTKVMGVNNPEQYQIPEFNSFESFLFDWFAEKDPNQLDYIFQPQFHFITDSSNNIIIDFVGKVENLTYDIEYIQNIVRKKIEVNHLNTTGNSESYTNRYTSDKMIELVNTKYEKDIALFNYKFSQ